MDYGVGVTRPVPRLRRLSVRCSAVFGMDWPTDSSTASGDQTSAMGQVEVGEYVAPPPKSTLNNSDVENSIKSGFLGVFCSLSKTGGVALQQELCPGRGGVFGPNVFVHVQAKPNGRYNPIPPPTLAGFAREKQQGEKTYSRGRKKLGRARLNDRFENFVSFASPPSFLLLRE